MLYLTFKVSYGIVFGLLVLTVSESLGLISNQPLAGILQQTISEDGLLEDLHIKYFLISITLIWLVFLLRVLEKSVNTLTDLPKPIPLYIHFIYALVIAMYLGPLLGVFSLPELFFEEDGIFESLTALSLFCAAAYLLIPVFRVTVPNMDRALKSLLFVAALALMFLALEEISYGQRIFGWSTNEFFAAKNDQQETNFHNMVDETFSLPLGMILIATVLVLVSTETIRESVKRKWASALVLFPPDLRHVYILALLVVLVNFNELFEVLFGLFVFQYAREIYARILPEGVSRDIKSRPPLQKESNPNYR